MRARRQLFGEYAFLGHYKAHPDRNQERFFFGLLKECVAKGLVSEEFLREQMRLNHVRHDAFEAHAAAAGLRPSRGTTQAISRSARCRQRFVRVAEVFVELADERWHAACKARSAPMTFLPALPARDVGDRGRSRRRRGR
jgi:hypothetical protein